jgi:hypothetical protein
MFTINAYIENPGSDVLDDWYLKHPPKQWARLWAQYYTIWLHLRQQPRNGWVGSYYHPLTGKEGVGRIGFQHKRIAYRHLGFFGPQANEFTLLFLAEEHNDIYEPRGCEDIAVFRMKLISQDRSRIREATIRGPSQ